MPVRGRDHGGAAFAHVDLALSIVQAQSPTLAETVARYLLIGNRKSQVGFMIPAVLAKGDPVMAAFERWVREYLHEPVTIAVAARVGYQNGSTPRDVVRRRRGMTLRELRNGPAPIPPAG
ncbi:MAG: hypothetical protein JO100_05495 [Pseudonocardia sp.]|nr:hypothetical protein [Pseudonocardia sp.]